MVFWRNISSCRNTPSFRCRRAFLEMSRAITACGLHPVTGHIYPLKETIPAYRHLASGTQFGKIVIAF